MTKIIFINGKLKVAILKAKLNLSKWWMRYIIVPLIFMMPTSFLVIYYTKKSIKLDIDSYLSEGAITFLSNHSLVLFFCSLFFLYLLSILYPVLESLTTQGNNITVENSLTLFEGFDRVVSAKSERFNSELKKLMNDSTLNDKATATFEKIAQPEQQIVLLIYALHIFLENMSKNVDFKVRLIETDGTHAVDWFTYAPENKDPQTEIDELNHPDTAFTHCLKKRKMQVIEDINKEARKPKNRRYVITSDDDGSAVCYPIYHNSTKTRPYVIAIWASKPGFFINSRKTFYSWILGQFAIRIKLEHSLLKIKELVA